MALSAPAVGTGISGLLCSQGLSDNFRGFGRDFKKCARRHAQQHGYAGLQDPRHPQGQADGDQRFPLPGLELEPRTFVVGIQVKAEIQRNRFPLLSYIRNVCSASQTRSA